MMDFIKQQAKNLFPGSFASVMATGALSIGLHLLGFHKIAPVFLVLNTLLYIVLWLLTIIRLFFYPGKLVTELMSHGKGAGFFTLVAGTAVYGSQLILTAGQFGAAMWLWGVSIVLWIVIMYTFFTGVTIRKEKPSLEKGFNGTWLLLTVATQSVSVLGTLLAPQIPDHQDLILFASLSMFFLGCMLYLPLMALVFYRFTFVKFRYDELSPPYWISMGALAITTLAGSALILHASSFSLLNEISPFLKGFTLFFWITGTWWIPILVILSIWHYGFHRMAITYNPQIWSMVFPLAMYTAGTFQFSNALNLPFLEIFSKVMVVVASAAWLGALLAMLVSVVLAFRQTVKKS